MSSTPNGTTPVALRGAHKAAYRDPTRFYTHKDSCTTMARNNKINMPRSGAGITQYFDDYKSKITFQPIHIVVFAIVVILIQLLLWLSL